MSPPTACPFLSTTRRHSSSPKRRSASIFLLLPDHPSLLLLLFSSSPSASHPSVAFLFLAAVAGLSHIPADSGGVLSGYGWGVGGLLIGALGPGRSPLPCSGDGAPPPGGWLGATEVARQVCSGSVAPDLAAGQHARGAVWWWCSSAGGHGCGSAEAASGESPWAPVFSSMSWSLYQQWASIFSVSLVRLSLLL